MRELEDHQTGIGYFETLMRYLFSIRADLTRDDFHELVAEMKELRIAELIVSKYNEMVG
ncbi:hypothetical protein [Desulfitobacterium hafniense]|uniref:hypothetical protein n=1 Tax=Desulfitobacterium hafniense TaxID=49338 RepID=UPI00130514C5|nr:hypothetical protein [Desulfitobacterium hafniense]